MTAFIDGCGSLLRTFLDRLLGERCPACQVRVFPADRRLHADQQCSATRDAS